MIPWTDVQRIVLLVRVADVERLAGRSNWALAIERVWRIGCGIVAPSAGIAPHRRPLAAPISFRCLQLMGFGRLAAGRRRGCQDTRSKAQLKGRSYLYLHYSYQAKVGYPASRLWPVSLAARCQDRKSGKKTGYEVHSCKQRVRVVNCHRLLDGK